jgi:hypothetical protein
MLKTARLLLGAVPGIAAIWLAGLQFLAQEGGFFPQRPKDVKLSTATGTLLDYGIGMKSGGFIIANPEGGITEEAYPGASGMINIL